MKCAPLLIALMAAPTFAPATMAQMASATIVQAGTHNRVAVDQTRAVASSILIEQAGSGNLILVTQAGSHNAIAARQTGDQGDGTLRQRGTGNHLTQSDSGRGDSFAVEIGRAHV